MNYPPQIERTVNLLWVALKIFRDIGYKQGKAIDLGNLAAIYRQKGDFNKAEKYQEESDKLNDEMGIKKS